MTGHSSVLATCDAVVTASSYVVEPKGCDRVTTLLDRRGAKFFAVGPLNPPAPGGTTEKEGEIAQSDAAGAIEEFLEAILVKRGEKSLLYVRGYYVSSSAILFSIQVSFGSLFAPTEPEKFHAWLEVVIEMEIPVVQFYTNPSFIF